MTKVLAGLQYVKTLEDIYRDGDPDIGPLRTDDTSGIRTMNSVFYRRNQEEMDDGAEAQLLEAFRTLRHRKTAGDTGMTEDQARMLENRTKPRRAIMPPPDVPAEERPMAGNYMDVDLDGPGDASHPVVQEVVAEARETHAQEMSRRAQFAQAASSGLSAASGAAESIIGHTASALKLLPAAAGAARDIIGEEAQFWGPNGPVAGAAAHGIIMGAAQARKNHQEYSGYAAHLWDSAAPVGTAMKEFLVGKTPNLIAAATPEQEMRKALEYSEATTAPSSSSSSSAAAIGDWDTHIFGPRAGLPILAPPPEKAAPPLALMGPPPAKAPPPKAVSKISRPPPPRHAPYGRAKPKPKHPAP